MPLRPLTFLLLLLASIVSRAAEGVSFRADVMAVLSKAGCNIGGCHGNGQGKGGLKLSLRGQDPDLDWAALARDQGGRRINLEEPEKSLILLKATAAIAHDGGQRFTSDSHEYGLIKQWLLQGGYDSPAGAPKVTKLLVTPPSQVLIEPATQTKLSAVAQFSDGSKRDVTDLAVYEPNNQLVKVTHDGLVTREKAGESTILVRYLDQQVPVTLSFVPARPDFAWQPLPAANYIDEQVFAKLKTLRMNPSALASDREFLRRAYLDLLGLVPTATEARAFLADPTPDKRARVVDALLEREEFADFWALKWADLLKIEERQLDIEGMRVFHAWIRDSLRKNKPLDQFAREIIAARGSTFQNAPANWWRANRDPVTRAESTARVFLGTQLNCAQCHNHPFERWTQDDYYNWASLFSRVDYKVPDFKKRDINDKNEFRGDQDVIIKPTGFVLNPRTGEGARPRFLGGDAPKTDAAHDELQALSDWLAHSPMFARTQVNRIWFHLLGRGLVDPVDDFRASNPPSHPALLDALVQDFTGHGYDLRHIIRTIMASKTYQLDAEPNATNAEDEANFSHAITRRLSAEQLIDSVSLVLGVTPKVPGFPAGTRLAQVPEGKKHYHPIVAEVDRFAATFGKPPRLIASECERSNDVALPQVFQLISGPMIQDLLTRKGGRLDTLLADDRTAEDQVQELFWTVLSRPATDEEKSRTLAYFASAGQSRRAGEDVLWALLNSKEFLFRH